MNHGVDVDFNKPSQSYVRLQEIEKGGRTVTKHDPKKQPLQVIKDGFKVYQSPTLYYDQKIVRGYLIKRRMVRKMFHTSNFHKRHWTLDFANQMVWIRKGDENDKL